MPELAIRMDGWNYVHGMCCNPHSIKHSPGGSGSARIPAACCGIAGFRPSRGRWPCAGVVPIDSRKDTPGPMGGCVADLALLDAMVMGEDQVQAADLNGIQIS